MDSHLKLDINAARNAIAAIRKLDLRKESIDTLIDLLVPVFRGYSVSAPRFDPGLKLFRARRCEKPSNIRELWYPPPSIVRLGRVNRSGSPVLYCCTSRETPFFEMRPSVGDNVAIARWVTSSPLLVNQAGYTAQAFLNLGSTRQHGWGPQPAEIPFGEGNEEVAEFLAEIFTQQIQRGEEHFYKLTVAVAEKLSSFDLFDGLIYPTVAMRANADNFALKPRFADAHLKFLKAEFARIDGVRDFGYDINVLDTATALRQDGFIQWKGHVDNWTLRPGEQVAMHAENGEWVAKDLAGNIVPPD